LKTPYHKLENKFYVLPWYSTELKLIDVPDLEYKSTDINLETGKYRPWGCVKVLFYLRDI
jgi:hypothetical protein